MATRQQPYTCPCCKGYIGEAAPISDVIAAEASWVSQAILEALSKPVGRRVRRDRIIEAIYQQSDEPENSLTVFAVTMVKLRRRLKTSGWCIVTDGSKGGPAGDGGALYRLIPLEKAA